MDCKYIKQNDIHERYLLDKLNENEKAAYLSHLSSCEVCKNNLDSEKDIIHSVRHISKIEMKSEISRQVAEIKSREKDVSWDMILKVAAIFFFLVITPGLVYYYQSIEPPKISELYNFDEVINQPKEMEYVEEEEKTERKEKTGNILVDNPDEKRKANISDVLGSAEGKGSVPSIQSVGITKHAKKSTSPTVASGGVVAKDDKKIEKERPISSPPSSASQSFKTTKKRNDSDMIQDESFLDDMLDSQKTITPGSIDSFLPDLKKFKKPNSFLTMDHEYLKGKNFRNDAESYQGSTNVLKTPKAQRLNNTEQKIYDKNLRVNQIYQLRYNINDDKVYINLVPLYDNSDFYLQKSYPDSFPVIKKKWHNVNNILDCFINEKIRTQDPENFSIYLNESDILYLYISNEKLYKIDLKAKTTKAISLN